MFASLLINILPFALVMILIYYFVFKRMGGGANAALNLGRNKVKIYDRKEMKTSFNDVAGVDEAKEELREVVDFLKNPKKYQRLGGRIPKGVLLLGPPGCGKTLLARAVAGEANVPFFFMSGSEFVEMFVGLGAARVRELFQQAKEKAPALVFLDEIDTIGKGRAGAMGAGFGAHDEREQTLNQLLVEMDGFDSSKGVIIMAATNRPDVLDAALVRPGRFDRQVVVDRPDLRGREEILRVHARGVALDPDVQLRTIASRTPGFTGADLENVVNEAALLAARREKNSVTEEELEEAIDRAQHGSGAPVARDEREGEDPRREPRDGPRARRPLQREPRPGAPHHDHPARHGGARPDDGAPARGSLPRHRARAEGHARVRDGRPRRRGALLRRGLDRRAERPGARDAGGARDGRGVRHERARSVRSRSARRTRTPCSTRRRSRATPPRSIDQEVNRLLNEAHDRAEQILIERRDLLGKLSALLLVTETIDGTDLEAYATGTKPIPDPATAQPNGKAHGRPMHEPDTVPAHGGATPPTPPMPGR